jgi:hypothetical protein
VSKPELEYQNIGTSQCRYGTMSYLKADLVIGRSLEDYGEWAQAELDFLLDLIETGNAVFDIGAFIGTHTLAFAQRVGTLGIVCSFEPQTVPFQL